MKRMKLVPNWYGPFRVIFADHPVYRIEIKTQNRTFTKVVTRDRIKRAKSDAIISNFNENIFMETESLENNVANVHCNEQGHSSEGDDDNHNDNDNADNIVNNYRARLRPRPVIRPDYVYCITVCLVFLYVQCCMYMLQIAYGTVHDCATYIVMQALELCI